MIHVRDMREGDVYIGHRHDRSIQAIQKAEIADGSLRLHLKLDVGVRLQADLCRGGKKE